MAEAEEREDAIQDSATGPKRMRGDEGEIEQHDLVDQIEADRYLGSRTAVDSSKTRGLRFMRIEPPGGTGV